MSWISRNLPSGVNLSQTVLAALIFLVGCNTTQPTGITDSNAIRPADLQIVDCLLPGQLRRLGGTTYTSARRPVSTTAADCRVRGGEYVEFDRANYKTALRVWMSAAQNGDAEAQVNVGEIFERGLGTDPNYEAAALWYGKAAEQGNSRAQFNLGTLYEQGLGVEKDSLQALNWYRRAWDLPEDDVIFQSAARRQQQALRDALEKQLADKATQIKLLNKQIRQLQEKLDNQDASQALNRELEQLRAWVARLEQEKTDTQAQYSSLPVFREPKVISAPVKDKPARETLSDEMEFGKYYALIIGNQNYNHIEDLYSPLKDAVSVAEVLTDKYGFAVQTLLDANNVTVMQAINDLNQVIKEDDNLLIYYAGHGTRVQTGELEDGYWLPVNANPPPTDTFWVSNEFITRHLGRLKAKRVLVVADSCYAGLLSSSPGFLFLSEKQSYTEDYIRYKLAKRSRLLLSSGGDQPVLDNAGEGHSVFARALLDELKSNDQILAGPELYIKIRDRVSAGAKKVGFEQQPEFKVIKGAGHEVGDFFFVPSK